MVKTNYDYPAKRLARQKLANFIIRHYPDRRQRRNLTYACLPGFDDGSGTSRELVEITDVVGIPRSNVYGIESDGEVYKKLLSSRPEIKLFYGTDREFFEKIDKKFDVISLDYTGQMLEPTFDMYFDHIFGRELLNSPGIFHTNFYGSREHENVKATYNKTILGTVSNNIFEAAVRAYRQLRTIEQAQNLRETTVERLLLLKQLMHDTSNAMPDIAREGVTANILHIANNGRAIQILPKEDPKKALIGYSILKTILEERGIPPSILPFFLDNALHPYFCDDMERMSYIGDNHAPMLTDIFLFDQHRAWFDSKTYPLSLVDKSDCKHPHEIEFSLNIDGKKVFLCDHSTFVLGKFDLSNGLNYEHPFVRRFVSHTENVMSKMQDGQEMIKQREFLGSSAKQKTENAKEKFSGEELTNIRKLVENRVPDKKILTQYPISRQQLAAFKAWKTMRERKQGD